MIFYIDFQIMSFESFIDDERTLTLIRKLLDCLAKLKNFTIIQ